jgi:hypothetical protein
MEHVHREAGRHLAQQLVLILRLRAGNSRKIVSIRLVVALVVP